MVRQISTDKGVTDKDKGCRGIRIANRMPAKEIALLQLGLPVEPRHFAVFMYPLHAQGHAQGLVRSPSPLFCC